MPETGQQEGEGPGLEPGMHPSFISVLKRKESIRRNLSGIKHKIGVYSAKGGVGKTTVSVNLAYALSAMGFRVGLLDADIDCPNITMFLGIDQRMDTSGFPLEPVLKDGIKVASTAMIVDDMKRPIIWRGPIIVKMLYDFFENTEWGELDYLIIDLPPGCLPEGTLIRMGNNYSKPIERIAPGEYVYSYRDGGLIKNKVLAVLPQGKCQTFKIKTPNRTVLATPNHPFLKYCWDNVYHWHNASQLRVGDRLLVANCVDEGAALKLPRFEESVHNTNTRITVPAITDEKFMRIVGHFVGDGFIKSNKRRNKIIGIRVCEPKHSRYRERYENLYEEIFSCNVFDDGKSTFGANSLPMVKLFRHLDLDHPALEKRIPEWVFTLPLAQRQAFIAGYSEADGSIRHREVSRELPTHYGQTRMVKIVNDVVGVASTNETLVRQLHELCQISGFRSTNVRSRLRKGNYLGRRKIRESVNYEFDYSQKHDSARFKLARIKAIESAGPMDAYDLQLEREPHNFIANNIIVHNTSDAPLTIMQVLDLDGFIIVTTPQRISGINSIRSGLMAKRLNASVLGVVENMSSGYPSASTMEVASTLNTRLLGTVKLDPVFSESSDRGLVPVARSEAARGMFNAIAKSLVAGQGAGTV